MKVCWCILAYVEYIFTASITTYKYYDGDWDNKCPYKSCLIIQPTSAQKNCAVQKVKIKKEY